MRLRVLTEGRRPQAAHTHGLPCSPGSQLHRLAPPPGGGTVHPTAPHPAICPGHVGASLLTTNEKEGDSVVDRLMNTIPLTAGTSASKPTNEWQKMATGTAWKPNIASLLFVLIMSATSLVANPEDLEPCEGCVDQTGDPAVDLESLWFAMGIQVTKMDGACFILPSNGACVMAQPCTPYLQVWGSAPANSDAIGGGSAGGVGLGKTRVHWGSFEGGDAKFFYEDYIGVDCGGSIAFFYQIDFEGPWPVPDATGTINLTLVCSACVN